MTDTKKSKVDIELGRITKTEYPCSPSFCLFPTFYIGFFGMSIYQDGKEPEFRSYYTAYAKDFIEFEPIYLAGFGIVPQVVFDYMQVCEDYARRVGRQMRRHGVTTYELKNGSPDTGIVFDESLDKFAYLRTDGAKMDPIPNDGIELFRKTLEECLSE